MVRSGLNPRETKPGWKMQWVCQKRHSLCPIIRDTKISQLILLIGEVNTNHRAIRRRLWEKTLSRSLSGGALWRSL
jgi:hypothetical protein